MSTGVFGDNLIQLGSGGISTAQLGFHVLLAGPLDDRPPTDTPHIDVYESDITSGASSKGCILTTLFATSRRFLSVSEASRSRSVNVLVGDNPGDFLTTRIKGAPNTLLDGGENYIGREDEFISLPECGSGRKWRGTRIVEIRGRCMISVFSMPWW